MMHKKQRSIDLDFLAFGDSTTEASAGGIPEGNRWPALLGTRFAPARLIQNRGVGGERSDQILTRVQALPANPKMNCIFWAGRNDVSQGVAQATTLSNIAAMVTWCGHSRYRIIGVTAKTDGTENIGSAARTAILALNAQLATTYGPKFIDISGLDDNDSLRADGLHFNAAGQLALLNNYIWPSVSTL